MLRCSLQKLSKPRMVEKIVSKMSKTPPTPENASRKDFFISYTTADRQWAEWIAWTLEEAGYTTVLQAWDFRPGDNFVLEMQKASEKAERTIMVLSPAYLQSRFSAPEWAAAFAQDPTGEKGLLLPVRVQECDLQGLLPQIVYIDLVGRTEEEARAALLTGVDRRRAKPPTPPPFPGASAPEKPRFPGALPSVWNVPHLRNPNFTGRERLLTQLHDAFTRSQTVASRQPQALCGLGGVGKTQLALEYVYRHAADYERVWWIRSGDASTCTADFIALAAALRLPVAADPEQKVPSDVVIAAVRRWLEQHGAWLLIFDNAPEPEAVRDYFPRGGGGHIIVTSRNPTWQGTATAFPVAVFDRQESVAYVLTTARQDDEAAATTLAKTLGDLPLALAQAAAYISAAGISLSGYLDRFQEKRAELWKNEKAPAEYGETVATTWAVAMQKLIQEVPTAAAVLNLCAFLAPDNIPRSLLTEHPVVLPEELAPLAADSLLLDRAIMALRQYALLDANTETLTVHRLVQAVTRDRLNKDEQVSWTKAALQVLGAAFPSETPSPEDWPLYEPLVPHALAAVNHAAPYDALLPAVTWLLIKTGLYWAGRGQWDDAVRVMSQALETQQRILGTEHPETLASMANLANVYSSQGRYEQARTLHEQALAAKRRMLGAEHPDTLNSMNNLAIVYFRQGRYEQARTLHEQALAAKRRMLGPDHPDTLASMTNLANVYLRQGRYEQAQTLYEQVLAASQRVLGAEHPYTLASMASLANVYLRQGRYEQARTLYEQALATGQRVLGAEHPHTLASMTNLANVYLRQGRYEQAESLYKQALETMEQVLGAEHPDTLTNINNLANVYLEQERYAQALPLHEEVLAARQRVLGPEHPDILASMTNLATVYLGQRRYAQALSLYEPALEKMEQVLGPEHPDTLRNIMGLVDVYLGQGRYAQARPLCERLVVNFERMLGPDHPETQRARSNLRRLRSGWNH